MSLAILIIKMFNVLFFSEIAMNGYTLVTILLLWLLTAVCLLGYFRAFRKSSNKAILTALHFAGAFVFASIVFQSFGSGRFPLKSGGFVSRDSTPDEFWFSVGAMAEFSAGFFIIGFWHLFNRDK